jgi:hypothetical protein
MEPFDPKQSEGRREGELKEVYGFEFVVSSCLSNGIYEPEDDLPAAKSNARQDAELETLNSQPETFLTLSRGFAGKDKSG